MTLRSLTAHLFPAASGTLLVHIGLLAFALPFARYHDSWVPTGPAGSLEFVRQPYFAFPFARWPTFPALGLSILIAAVCALVCAAVSARFDPDQQLERVSSLLCNGLVLALALLIDAVLLLFCIAAQPDDPH